MKQQAARTALIVVGLAALAAPASAGAAQIGETFPGADGSCDTGTVLQSSSPGSPPQYAAPPEG